MGYGSAQTAELEATVNASGVDLVIAATPIDLRRIIHVRLPLERVRYELQIIGVPTLRELVAARLKTRLPADA
jgi:predicted GTPase